MYLNNSKDSIKSDIIRYKRKKNKNNSFNSLCERSTSKGLGTSDTNSEEININDFVGTKPK